MRNALYLNTGTHRFMEIAQLAGVANTDWTWSLKFGDFDEDGWTDLYVTCTKVLFHERRVFVAPSTDRRYHIPRKIPGNE